MIKGIGSLHMPFENLLSKPLAPELENSGAIHNTSETLSFLPQDKNIPKAKTPKYTGNEMRLVE